MIEIEIPKEKEEAIKQDLVTLKKEVADMVVSNDEQMAAASKFLSLIKSRLNRLKDMRDDLVKPMKAAVKHADDWFKLQTEPYTMLESQVKGSLSVYIAKKELEAKKEQERLLAEQRERDRIAREAQEAADKAAAEAKNAKQRKEAERLAEEAKKAAAAQVPAEILEKPKVSVRTENGLVSSSKRWTWEVQDFDAIDRSLLTVDNAKITNLVRNGERSIAGIRVFQEVSVRVS